MAHPLTIVITGGSDGVGRAAARALKRAGNEVVIVGRTPAKVEATASELGVDGLVADFSRLADVRTLAATLLDRYPRIDVLANNAGGIFSPRIETIDGHEATLQVNHLAPFLLTHLLLDRLATYEGRIINTASMAHLRARLDLSDLDLTEGFTSWKAYCNSKLCNILFTRALAPRIAHRGVTTASFHPGVVASSFGATGGRLTKLFYAIPLAQKAFMVTPDQGADTLVWLSTQPQVAWESGGYYDRRHPGKLAPAAKDDALAEGLWSATERMLGL